MGGWWWWWVGTDVRACVRACVDRVRARARTARSQCQTLCESAANISTASWNFPFSRARAFLQAAWPQAAWPPAPGQTPLRRVDFKLAVSSHRPLCPPIVPRGVRHLVVVPLQHPVAPAGRHVPHPDRPVAVAAARTRTRAGTRTHAHRARARTRTHHAFTHRARTHARARTPSLPRIAPSPWPNPHTHTSESTVEKDSDAISESSTWHAIRVLYGTPDPSLGRG